MAAVAVFMMIMVAFAPMASIFTDDQGLNAAADKDGTISIGGKVIYADGTGVADASVKVIITGGNSGTYYAIAGSDGAYKFTFPALDDVMTLATITVENGTDGDVAYGYTFGSVVLDDIQSSVLDANLIAKDVKVTVTLNMKSGSQMYIDTDSAVAITGTYAADFTGESKLTSGVFTVFAPAGKTYAANAITLSSTIGFKNVSSFSVGSGATASFSMGADDYVGYTSSYVKGNITGTTLTNVSLGSQVQGTYNSMFYTYKVLTFTAAATSASAKFTYTSSLGTNIATVTQENVTSLSVGSNNSLSFPTINVAVGKVTIGAVPYTGAVVTLYEVVTNNTTGVSADPVSKGTYTTLAGGMYYIGFNAATTPADGYTYTYYLRVTTPASSIYTFDDQVVSVSGTQTDKNFECTNEVKVTGKVVDTDGTGIKALLLTITSSSGNIAIPEVNYSGAAEVKTGADGTYTFFASPGSNIIIAPKDNPSYYDIEKYTFTPIISDRVANFALNVEKYTVNVVDQNSAAVSGIEVMFALNGVTFASAGKTDAGGKVIITLGTGISITNAKVYAVDGNDYTFAKIGTSQIYVKTSLATSTTLTSLEGTYKGIVKDANGMALKEVAVNLNVYTSGVFVKTVATSTTNSYGVFSFAIIGANLGGFTENGVEYTYKAVVADGTSVYGKYTFANGNAPTSGVNAFGTMNANEKTLSGYYAGSSVVSGVKVTYVLVGTNVYVTGQAVVLDNKYYVTFVPSTTSSYSIDPAYVAETKTLADTVIGEAGTLEAAVSASTADFSDDATVADTDFNAYLIAADRAEYLVGIAAFNSAAASYTYTTGDWDTAVGAIKLVAPLYANLTASAQAGYTATAAKAGVDFEETADGYTAAKALGVAFASSINTEVTAFNSDVETALSLTDAVKSLNVEITAIEATYPASTTADNKAACISILQNLYEKLTAIETLVDSINEIYGGYETPVAIDLAAYDTDMTPFAANMSVIEDSVVVSDTGTITIDASATGFNSGVTDITIPSSLMLDLVVDYTPIEVKVYFTNSDYAKLTIADGTYSAGVTTVSDFGQTIVAVLEAQPTAYKSIDDTTVTAGEEVNFQKVFFKGWFADGVEISKDAVATYTVTDDVVITAEYDVNVVSDDGSKTGINSTTLIIGIVAVVLALVGVALVFVNKKN